jgi:uncharacterized protein
LRNPHASRLISTGARSIFDDLHHLPPKIEAQPILSESENASKFVRDLNWAISSPPLLKLGDASLFPALRPEQIDEEHLHRFISERTEHRVGHYFENLVHFWLKHIRGLEIVEHRRQVRDEDRTLGEIDFIFRDESGRLVHWETAIKFYLKTRESGDQAPRYLGPNTADSLERKIARLRDHQLPLGNRVHEQIDIHHAFVKGRIYYHPFDDGARGGPGELAGGHLCSSWIHHEDLTNLTDSLADTPAGFSILSKPFWLTPSEPPLQMDQLSRVVARHFAQSPNSLHLALHDRHNQEPQYLFVVAGNWPDLQPD